MKESTVGGDLPVLTDDFPCKGCGACCMHMSMPYYMPDEESELRSHHPEVYEELIALRETREIQLQVTGQDEIPCAFLDLVTRKCRHHDVKPQVCRDFEIGGGSCLMLRKRAGLEPIDPT